MKGKKITTWFYISYISCTPVCITPFIMKSLLSKPIQTQVTVQHKGEDYNLVKCLDIHGFYFFFKLALLKKNNYLLIYLAERGLGCSMWDLFLVAARGI